MTVANFGEHSIHCWSQHDECALRAAVGYLSARIEHDRARAGLYRRAINADPLSEDRVLAVELARDLLTETHKINWKRADTA